MLLVGLVVVTWLEDWRFGIAVAGFASFFVVTQLWANKLVMPFWEAELAASAAVSGFLGESLAGVRDIQKSAAGPFAMYRFYELLRSWMRNDFKAGLASGVATGITFSVNSMRLAAGLATAAYLFQLGDITIGTAYLMYHYLVMIGGPILSLSREFEDLQQAAASIRRVKELLDTETRVPEGTGGPLPAGQLPVDFQGVSFGYNPEVPVLTDVSFRLAPGKSLGILGRTGSGKTTISRMLMRFYDPDRGSVRLGDVDVRGLRRQELRRRVAMVTQEVQVFQATLRENLALFDTAIPDAKLVAALETLGLGDWFGSLPHGLDEPLEAGGGGLSAGESQLLAFARVFLRDPDVIVLDEASSRLDPATESLIQKAVDGLLADRTALIVAHRLATVQRVDEIMIVEDGQVREHGDRLELASDPSSRFASLMRVGLEEVLA